MSEHLKLASAGMNRQWSGWISIERGPALADERTMRQDEEAWSSELLARAVRVFLTHAYGEEVVPPHRRHWAEMTSNHSIEQWLSQKGVEQPREIQPGMNVKYAFRLGNRWYPHMKMLVAFMPPGDQPLFSVDTHDRIEVPAGSPEEAGMRELQAQNRELARSIELAWDQAGVPTQAGLLKKYLAAGLPTNSPS
jgi:hypothetical protein